MPMSAKLDPALADKTAEALLNAVRDRAATTTSAEDLRQLAVAFERILAAGRTATTDTNGGSRARIMY